MFQFINALLAVVFSPSCATYLHTWKPGRDPKFSQKQDARVPKYPVAPPTQITCKIRNITYLTVKCSIPWTPLTMDCFGILFLLFMLTSPSFGTSHDKCTSSPHYLEIGKTGSIECHFQDGFYAVVWYTPESYVDETPLVGLVDGVKIGHGLSTGEYDIHEDGSLIIRNVTFLHDSDFTALTFQSEGDDPIYETVKVVVVVKPPNPFPVTETCTDEAICYTTIYKGEQVLCHIGNSRPAVNLSWVARTHRGDVYIPSQNSVVTKNGSVFTSRAETKDAFYFSTFLSLLICKADDNQGILLKNESAVFIEKGEIYFQSMVPIVKYIEKHLTLKLVCSERNISLVVWKKAYQHDDVFQVLSYAAYVGKGFSKTKSNKYILQDDGSLLVPGIASDDEGLYGCIYDNGDTRGTLLFDVIVYVPVTPVVEGCTHHEHCALDAQREGSLTCSVKGIRPKVQLTWKPFSVHESSLISFTDHQMTTNSNGDVYDITLNSTYKLKDPSTTRITIECTTSKDSEKVLKSSAKFELYFNNDQPTYPSTSQRYLLWILIIIISLCLIAVVLCTLYALRVRGRRGKKRKGNYSEHKNINLEVIPMIGKNDFQGKRDMFISQLKAKYQDLYDAVQPIPYIRDRLYCVDRVFVEGGIEYLVTKDRIGGQGTWDKLSSYHKILDDDRVKSTRRIIEGEPGYGKSTLTLQLSYDWCNKIPLSYLKDIDVLILLRLRQLGGVTSVYRAIKQFLLPKDSKLTESDIADIISECSSVLVILDGYDEYPDQDVSVDSDVISIIMRNMFQQFEVILTTRSSYLPNKYPAMTKRLKLTGFDENARNQYIRKAVVGDDVTAAEKIKQRLKENPVLGDLCQVPLFFVMFAHMSHESEQFQKFNSVTSFFRYMISCFHSHMKNKMEDDNVKKYDLFETEHTELDKLAFEGLNRKDQQIVWNKHYMCERLGQDFYDQYVRMGILVEEEVLDICDDPNAIISEHIQYKTEVRFYHKLFCEWYAAHHLSEYASRDDVTFEPWKSETRNNIRYQTNHYIKYLDPFDLQYVYRFSCGLNREAAEKIIEYLKTRGDAAKFAILCILEKSGKVEDVLKDVAGLCSGTVEINVGDTLLLQRSTMQLLEIATANKISISRVRLRNCYSTVDLRGGNHLQLKSNLSIPVLTTLNKLVIHEEGREITSEEFTGILQYSSKCLALKELLLRWCLLPPSVQAESVSDLRSRNVKVFWQGYNALYQLNLQSCLWEYESYLGRQMMTDEDYKDEVRRFR